MFLDNNLKLNIAGFLRSMAGTLSVQSQHLDDMFISVLCPLSKGWKAELKINNASNEFRESLIMVD